MKKLYIASVFLFLIGCSAVLSERQDWGFINEVGGLEVVGQDKNPNWLIIHGDVSGLHEFSSKPSTMNSALTVKSVKKKVTEFSIQIYIVTTLVSDKYPDPRIYGIDISDVKAGTYKIQYLNPDKSLIDLKTVNIIK